MLHGECTPVGWEHPWRGGGNSSRPLRDRRHVLPRPLLVTQVDQNNMFGSVDWRAIRSAMMQRVPNLVASTAWKHLLASEVERPGGPNPWKHRQAEQGDAAAPFEASATQACIARYEIHDLQRRGELFCLRAAGGAPAAAALDAIVAEVNA